MIEIYRVHDEPLELDVAMLSGNCFNGISFHRCLLNDLDFSCSILNDIDFRSAEMSNSKFTSSVISNSKLIMVKSNNTFFDGCNFKESMLLHSDFSGSSFKGADLSESTVSDVIFAGCDLRGANLSCVGLETCILTDAIYDDSTIWNKDFDIAASEGIKVE